MGTKAPRIRTHLGIGDVCISERDDVHPSSPERETRAEASSSTDVYQIDYDRFRNVYDIYIYKPPAIGKLSDP